MFLSGGHWKNKPMWLSLLKPISCQLLNPVKTLHFNSHSKVTLVCIVFLKVCWMSEITPLVIWCRQMLKLEFFIIYIYIHIYVRQQKKVEYIEWWGERGCEGWSGWSYNNSWCILGSWPACSSSLSLPICFNITYNPLSTLVCPALSSCKLQCLDLFLPKRWTNKHFN